jgi:hypothetical protein
VPAYKTPQSFPGMDVLPNPMRQLIEAIFPPDELPIAGMAGGAITPPGGLAGAKGMIWRGADDIKKIMPQTSQVPPPPPTGQAVGTAFDEYLRKIAQLLRQGQNPPR